MTAAGLDIDATIARARAAIESRPNLDPEIRTVLDMLLLILSVLAQRLGLNSRTSHKPPSTDRFDKVQSKRASTGKKAGGQPGRIGTTLEPVPEPDEVVEHRVSSCSSCGADLSRKAPDGRIDRQVIDVKLMVTATEHRAEKKTCACGCENKAAFPPGVDNRVQYGPGVKSFAVYLSQYQLLPYARIEETFRDQFGLPVSAGSVVNFVAEAAAKLDGFEAVAKAALLAGPALGCDETGVRVGQENWWLHVLSNEQWTWMTAHEKRGLEAMRAAGVLPLYGGTLVHDCWKPYFAFDRATHALCCAHHLRELQALGELEKLKWAWRMKALLESINEERRAKGKIPPQRQAKYQKIYRTILTQGERESPIWIVDGKPKKSKARLLLERLRTYEEETLRFMRDPAVPFTNNQSERDFRMAKVQQKVSGCFRSAEGAANFCRLRSFFASAKKHGASVFDSLDRLIRDGRWEFAAE